MSVCKAAPAACAPGWVGVLMSVFAWASTVPGPAESANLGALTSYTIQLQNVAGDFERLARSDFDLLIVEPSISDADGRRPLSRDEIRRLQTKPDGSRRVVLAYVSVGEAEDYRDYWRADWASAPPRFLIAENCQWRGNHLVRFWDPAWKGLLFGSPDAVLERLLDAGFDGVSLDRVDVFEDIETRYPQARAEMVRLVTQIAAHAHRAHAGAIVIAHNAESLLTDPAYRNAVDGVLKEDLLYGVGATGKPNGRAAVDWAEKHLALFRQEGKAVLVAEYLTDREQAESTELELLDRNFLPGIFPRALDGSDPFRPTLALDETMGTPERSAIACQGVWQRGASQ